ncbi:1-acyl-sn-glycerol-3-phosphate acyltransferase [Vitiosangium sp. GDMCC 1.1324]|uniref:lysophospholipid acyltransferase family protein n=1 Tax=Vitiosangium sp. (strain GDMCC 1.1324) TaxID=2138576 RepID=UPI000D3C6B7F|nr:lysophospholipid acyltransferase family protein [Vitiosangium sp. GDMCC 1.1324]PTL75901.1 1-acyl-sn-glycerol-3-phosphate acyltransferase [Vitiosangium sp. GDMCC 1.1324]
MIESTPSRPVQFLRTALAASWSMLSLVVFIPLALVALPVDRRQRVHDVCSILWARGILALLGVRLVVRGAERVSRDERYIIVANHQSLLDAAVVVAALQPLTPVRMVARRNAFRVPLIGWGMRLFGHISVDPRSIRASLPGLQQAQQQVARRWSILFFPEGGYSPDGRMRPFYNSAFHIAARGGVRVVPVTLSGTFDILPQHLTVPVRGGDVLVTLHPPVGPLEQTHEAALAASAACHQLVEAALPRP